MKKESPIQNFFKFFFGFWGLIAFSLLIIGSLTLYEFTLDTHEPVVEASSDSVGY